jgi:hypothetical protein
VRADAVELGAEQSARGQHRALSSEVGASRSLALPSFAEALEIYDDADSEEVLVSLPMPFRLKPKNPPASVVVVVGMRRIPRGKRRKRRRRSRRSG